MKPRHGAAVGLIQTVVFLLVTLCPLPLRAQSPPGSEAQPPTAGSSHSVSTQWNLSDLLEGLVRMQTSYPLTHAQARRIRPQLENLLTALKLMAKSESQIRKVLTPAQIRFIQQKQLQGELQVNMGPPAATRPGEDPMVTRVLQILQNRAR